MAVAVLDVPSNIPNARVALSLNTDRVRSLAERICCLQREGPGWEERMACYPHPLAGEPHVLDDGDELHR